MNTERLDSESAKRLLQSHGIQGTDEEFNVSISNNFFTHLEGAKIPMNETLYSSSDVLESIFGKYKIFSSQSPRPEISELVLTIPLCTINITSSFVIDAMENVSIRDVERWASHTFGQSTLNRKKAFFGR